MIQHKVYLTTVTVRTDCDGDEYDKSEVNSIELSSHSDIGEAVCAMDIYNTMLADIFGEWEDKGEEDALTAYAINAEFAVAEAKTYHKLPDDFWPPETYLLAAGEPETYLTPEQEDMLWFAYMSDREGIPDDIDWDDLK